MRNCSLFFYNRTYASVSCSISKQVFYWYWILTSQITTKPNLITALRQMNQHMLFNWLDEPFLFISRKGEVLWSTKHSWSFTLKQRHSSLRKSRKGQNNLGKKRYKILNFVHTKPSLDFPSALGWEDNDWIFISGWTVPLHFLSTLISSTQDINKTWRCVNVICRDSSLSPRLWFTSYWIRHGELHVPYAIFILWWTDFT